MRAEVTQPDMKLNRESLLKAAHVVWGGAPVSNTRGLYCYPGDASLRDDLQAGSESRAREGGRAYPSGRRPSLPLGKAAEPSVDLLAQLTRPLLQRPTPRPFWLLSLFRL